MSNYLINKELSINPAAHPHRGGGRDGIPGPGVCRGPARPLAWVLGLLCLAGFPSAGPCGWAIGAEFEYSLFLFDEYNRLRSTPPLAHFKVYEGVVRRYAAQLVNDVRIRVYERFDRTAEQLGRVLDYLFEDAGICVAAPANRGNPDMRKCMMVLRQWAGVLGGTRKALPADHVGRLDEVMRKMSDVEDMLGRFIEGPREAP